MSITPVRFLSSIPLNLPASVTIIILLEESRPAKYTYARPFIIMLTYPKKYEKDINLKIWNKAIIDFTKAKPQDLNGFLLHRIAHYKDSKYDNTML